MVKYCIDKYPMGSWEGQISPGRFMDGYLYRNLELFADKISKDMTFMGIIYSSTLEVGTGKSVLATQIGEAWTEIINKKYNLNLKYDVDNIVWRPKDLIERSFKLPKYSFILLDEWEDSTYWSELGISLRQFFRKCRQLNLFMICIIPNWFQLPLPYAVSRSIFAIDVRFSDTLDRGNFYFYNFPAKRALYINGKRNHNYKAWKPTFWGKFPDGYGVDEKEYRKRKYEDMLKYEKENPVKKTKAQIEAERSYEFFQRLIKKFPDMPKTDLMELLNTSRTTLNRWFKGEVSYKQDTQEDYVKELQSQNEKKKVVVDEKTLENQDKERSGENKSSPINRDDNEKEEEGQPESDNN